MTDRIQLGDAAVQLDTHEIVRGGVRTGLTPNEVSLLRYLWDHKGQIVSKGQLHTDVFGYAPRVVSRAADFAIHRLRKKVERDPAQPQFLMTVAGVGYRLVADAPMSESLPVPTTRLLGRDEDLAQVTGQLLSGRLVTVVGPAGMGKTRLAIEVGRASETSEVCLCVLTSTTDRASVCAAVGHALGVDGQDAGGIGRALAGSTDLLLILDNCEQVVSAVSELVEQWLEAAEGLTVLATSRERLQCRGESIHELRPLTDAGIELFVERATAAHPDFRVRTDEDGVAIAELVRQLDGLPLAIELAAARSSVLSPQQILERLDRDALGPAPRSAPDRQQSIDAAIQWSWDLLDADEQQTMAQLSAFRGSFSVVDAEAVVRIEGSVLDRVQSLRAKSLLAPGPRGPEPRFTFLRAVRTFAQAHCDELPALWKRHATWIASATSGLADRAPEPDARRALDAAHDNLQAALWRLDGVVNDPDLHARVLLASRPTWQRTWPAAEYLVAVDALLDRSGLTREHRLDLLLARAQQCCDHALSNEVGWATEALRHTTQLERPEARARVLLTRSTQHRRAHRFSDATADLDAAEALLPESEPVELHVRSALQRGTLALEQRNLRAAGAAFRKGLALSSRIGSAATTALLHLNLALLHGWEGRPEAQAEAARTALEQARILDDRTLQCRALLMLSVAQSSLGDLQSAAVDGAEAVTLATKARTWSTACEASVVLAGVEFAQADFEATEAHVARARKLQGHARAPWHVAYIDLWDALVSWARWGSVERAQALLSQGIERARGHLVHGELELQSKLLAAQVHLDPESAQTVARQFEVLADEARALDRPDLARTIESDQRHVDRVRGVPPTDDTDTSELGVRVSRVLLQAAGSHPGV